MIEPEDRWEPWRVGVSTTSGVSWVVEDPVRVWGFHNATTYERRAEPLLWDGDQA